MKPELVKYPVEGLKGIQRLMLDDIYSHEVISINVPTGFKIKDTLLHYALNYSYNFNVNPLDRVLFTTNTRAGVEDTTHKILTQVGSQHNIDVMTFIDFYISHINRSDISLIIINNITASEYIFKKLIDIRNGKYHFQMIFSNCVLPREAEKYVKNFDYSY